MSKQSFRPSLQQQAIFDFIRVGEGDGLIRATAGAGKTTTLKEVSKLIPKDQRVCFLAFNKAIRDELASKLPGTEVRTVHSLGNLAIADQARSWDVKKSLDKKKQDRLIRSLVDELLEEFTSANSFEARNFVASLLTFSRVNCIDLADLEQLRAIALKYNLRPSADPRVDEEIYRKIAMLHEKIVKEFKNSGIIDFQDMICLPIELELPIEQFDFICIDEAQDFSKVMLELVLRARAPHGRMLFVGDSRQAINGFIGADTNSLDRIVCETNAVELPLSVTFRCPKLHVQLAQKIAPEIRALEAARQGTVRVIKQKFLTKWVRQNDLVICRNNAPLVTTCVDLNRDGIAASIVGVDIGERLIKLAKQVFKNSLFNWQIRLEKFIADEKLRLNKLTVESQKHSLMNKMLDETRCLSCLVEDTQTQSKQISMRDFEQHIRQLFVKKPGNEVVLSTIHKAKGREANRVFILLPHLMSLEYAATSEAVRSEACVQFVALTRSKRDLIFVEENLLESERRINAALAGSLG